MPQSHSPSMVPSFSSANSGSGPIDEDVLSPRRSLAPALPVQQRLTPGSEPTEEEVAPPSQKTANDIDEHFSVVGPYAPTPALACPLRLMHGGQEWVPDQESGKSWMQEPTADHFFDTLQGSGEDQRGHSVVCCRVCAL